jgi:hypothetical protein
LIVAVAALALALAIACNDGGAGTTPSPEGEPSPNGPTSEVTPDVQASPPPGPILFLSPPPEVPATENVLAIPGFEECSDASPAPCSPWFALKPPNLTLSDVAHSGDTSALLRMREPPEAAGAKVFYLVQEVAPTEFPEVLSGFYRVENWLRGTEKQYLQFVVIVVRADNRPQEFSNHQIRYILSGIDEPPFEITNAKFVFLSKEDPPIGEWVPFQVNVKQDFIDLWGAAPEGSDFIRLLYEVRYDGKLPGSGATEADVYYDDLYFGPAEGAPTP